MRGRYVNRSIFVRNPYDEALDELGTINENELYINDKTKVTIDELSTSNKDWLNNYMSK